MSKEVAKPTMSWERKGPGAGPFPDRETVRKRSIMKLRRCEGGCRGDPYGRLPLRGTRVGGLPRGRVIEIVGPEASARLRRPTRHT
jgi:hypothetical protein